ncbi:MAG: NYN domain-containing protein [Candidatus Aminicenantes bacterium]|nr:NYN domain-containing protein [Candidatus Aminicenantes bacterium]
MPHLIDGNNLIGFTDPDNLNTPQGRINLIGKIQIFQAVSHKKVCLVFDGPPDPESDRLSSLSPSLRIVFPTPDQTADAVLMNLIRRSNETRGIFVVTSDRELKEFAKKHKKQVINCRRFSRELKDAFRAYRHLAAEEKEEKDLTRLELDHWLDLFK